MKTVESGGKKTKKTNDGETTLACREKNYITRYEHEKDDGNLLVLGQVAVTFTVTSF